MDNLTHSLIGLAAAKAGLEKLSPGATALCLVAANIPDADVVTLIGGRWTYLHHHRGITHSIAGTIALALLVPLIFYLVDKLIARVRKRRPAVRLRGLLIASLLVTASHPFMDWTNNYGVRPLLPGSSRWFYGDFVFIIDPFIWLILGGATFLVTSKSKKQIAGWLILAIIPTYLILFGPGNRGALGNARVVQIIWIVALVTCVVLFMREAGKRWGSRIPLSALGIFSIYLAGLFLIHTVAVRRAQAEGVKIANVNGERALEVAAMPTAANPFQWSCVVETEKAAYRFNVSLLDQQSEKAAPIRHPKPEALRSPAVAQSINSYPAQVFLDFARFPVVRVVGEDCLTQTLVQFADLRYTEPGSGRGTFSLDVPVACPQPATD
ncbi:MAG TPA: metal-dependent hydrolase [Pyrinomonadaceae bacterium]|nr:metal-dependent hydrolase [Pyrinomonadaceae bacterium]